MEGKIREGIGYKGDNNSGTAWNIQGYLWRF
jgi:hypothetical protein